MPPVGFEPTISTGERPKTYVLDRAVTGTVIVLLGIQVFILCGCLKIQDRNMSSKYFTGVCLQENMSEPVIKGIHTSQVTV